MKLFFFSILFVLLQHCSFDNKSGIWKNENSVAEIENEDGVFQDFKTISSTKETFNEIIPLKKNFKITLSPAISNYNWNDIFFNKTNNTKHFKYNDSNKLIFKSKKLSKGPVMPPLAFIRYASLSERSLLSLDVTARPATTSE